MNNRGICNIPKLKKLRRQLRNDATPAECALWKHLKAGRLDNTRWRRQYSIGNYILDFYCPQYKLCIEIDGESHNNSTSDEYDATRTEFLNKQQVKVIRFENSDIWNNLENVLEEIKRNLFEVL